VKLFVMASMDVNGNNEKPSPSAIAMLFQRASKYARHYIPRVTGYPRTSFGASAANHQMEN
jgi:hypothetical protein